MGPFFVQVAINVLYSGMQEYRLAVDTGKNLHHDEKVVQQPAIAGLLLEKVRKLDHSANNLSLSSVWL